MSSARWPISSIRRVRSRGAPQACTGDLADLRAIAEAAERARRDEALLTERVALARAHGRSWNRIAAALGVSRQAARQRFGGKVGA